MTTTTTIITTARDPLLNQAQTTSGATATAVVVEIAMDLVAGEALDLVTVPLAMVLLTMAPIVTVVEDLADPGVIMADPLAAVSTRRPLPPTSGTNS